jgi:hypothetical protein
MKHTYSVFRQKSLKTILIVTGSMSIAFIIGIQTAGDVSPVVLPTQADSSILAGDLNGNGKVDLDDVHRALEIANGYRTPTPAELAADPNHDFLITTDDAIAIVEQIKRTPEKPEVDL